MSSWLKILAAVVFAAIAIPSAWLFWVARPAGPMLYVGGPILTMNAGDEVVRALATEGDRIVAVGGEARLRAWAEEEGARVVELDGRAVVPGFIDAHGHFPGEGIYTLYENLNSPPIGSVRTIEDLVTQLTRRAAETSPGEWVVGMGYDDTLLAEQRHPNRADLDRVSREHPVAIVHISGHLMSVNSEALRLLEITRETPDPEGGLIRRDPVTGEPDGVLEETAMESVQTMFVPGPIEGFGIIRAATQIYLGRGMTTAQSGYTPQALMPVFPALSRIGLLPIRVVIFPDVPAADAMLDGSFEFATHDPLRVRAGAVKIVADGSIQGYTGYLSEPYAVPPGDDPSYRGYPRVPRDELIETVGRIHAAGLQLAVHGNGDASIDDILDAFEAAQRAHPRTDARHIVIHAQMTREDQLDRMQALGVIPSFFSLHTFYWGERHRRLFMGEERARRMSPAKSAADRGIRFTIHADSPVVPMEPLRLVWSAVNRRTRTGDVLGPEQRITPMQALRAVTIDAAHQHFEDGDKGSLEPGKLADLVILSRSPLEDPETIDEIRVLETVIAGRSVFQAD